MLGKMAVADITRLIKAVIKESLTAAFFISFLPWPGVIKANRRGGDPRHKSVAEEGEAMKREFLQNFKVGDQALPKEIIDQIMATLWGRQPPSSPFPLRRSWIMTPWTLCRALR